LQGGLEVGGHIRTPAFDAALRIHEHEKAMRLDRSREVDGFFCAISQVDLAGHGHRDGRNRLQCIPFYLGGLDSYERILQRTFNEKRTGLFQIGIKIEEVYRMT